MLLASLTPRISATGQMTQSTRSKRSRDLGHPNTSHHAKLHKLHRNILFSENGVCPPPSHTHATIFHNTGRALEVDPRPFSKATAPKPFLRRMVKAIQSEPKPANKLAYLAYTMCGTLGTCIWNALDVSGEQEEHTVDT